MPNTFPYFSSSNLILRAGPSGGIDAMIKNHVETVTLEVDAAPAGVALNANSKVAKNIILKGQPSSGEQITIQNHDLTVAPLIDDSTFNTTNDVYGLNLVSCTLPPDFDLQSRRLIELSVVSPSGIQNLYFQSAIPGTISAHGFGVQNVYSAFASTIPSGGYVNIDLSNNALSQGSVDGILAAVAATIGLVDVHISLSGGTNSPPSGTPAQHGQWSLATATPSGRLTGGDYIVFPFPSGLTYVFWFNLDGAGTAPGTGTYTIEVTITSSMTLGDFQSALGSALNGQGFSCSYDGISPYMNISSPNIGSGYNHLIFSMMNPYATGYFYEYSFSDGTASGSGGYGSIDSIVAAVPSASITHNT